MKGLSPPSAAQVRSECRETAAGSLARIGGEGKLNREAGERARRFPRGRRLPTESRPAIVRGRRSRSKELAARALPEKPQRRCSRGLRSANLSKTTQSCRK